MNLRNQMLLGIVASVAVSATALAQAKRDPKTRRDPLVEVMQEEAPGSGSNEDKLTPQDKQVLAWARECGAKITKVMEDWVKGGRLSRERLFSFLYYPVPATDPQKFNTDYDAMADQDIFPIQEECLSRSPSIRFVVTVDKNGYLPTHNQRYSQRLTGHKQIDLVNNRTKRIFNDRTGIRAARNTAEFLLQTYFRDTGEVMKDLSVPIVIDGKHWGGLRFGYAVE